VHLAGGLRHHHFDYGKFFRNTGGRTSRKRQPDFFGAFVTIVTDLIEGFWTYISKMASFACLHAVQSYEDPRRCTMMREKELKDWIEEHSLCLDKRFSVGERYAKPEAESEHPESGRSGIRAKDSESQRTN
jgi:hypothetical protein